MTGTTSAQLNLLNKQSLVLVFRFFFKFLSIKKVELINAVIKNLDDSGSITLSKIDEKQDLIMSV